MSSAEITSTAADLFNTPTYAADLLDLPIPEEPFTLLDIHNSFESCTVILVITFALNTVLQHATHNVISSDPLGLVLVSLPLAESIIYLDHFRPIEHMVGGLDNIPVLDVPFFVAL